MTSGSNAEANGISRFNEARSDSAASNAVRSAGYGNIADGVVSNADYARD